MTKKEDVFIGDYYHGFKVRDFFPCYLITVNVEFEVYRYYKPSIYVRFNNEVIFLYD